jgi:hypothetical protein
VVAHIDAGVLTKEEEASLLAWVAKGGAFVAIHTAIAANAAFLTGPDGKELVKSLNPGYHRMLNGIFDGHSE